MSKRYKIILLHPFTHFKKLSTDNTSYNIIFRPFSFSSTNINLCFNWSLSIMVSFRNHLKWSLCSSTSLYKFNRKSLFSSVSLYKVNSEALFSSEFQSLSNIWNLITPWKLDVSNTELNFDGLLIHESFSSHLKKDHSLIVQLKNS